MMVDGMHYNDECYCQSCRIARQSNPNKKNMTNEISKKDQEIGYLKAQIEIILKLKKIDYVDENQRQKLIKLVAETNFKTE